MKPNFKFAIAVLLRDHNFRNGTRKLIAKAGSRIFVDPFSGKAVIEGIETYLGQTDFRLVDSTADEQEIRRAA